jgi:hypothetical protein
MAEFTLGAYEIGPVISTDFSEYINIVTGRSIISGADWGKDRVEFGLSGDGMVRIFWTPDGLHLNFLSTTNVDEIPPLLIQIPDGDKRLPARVVELRLRALRTLYALVHLYNTKRFYKVLQLIKENPDADLDELLDPQEYLYIECLSPGSWYVTVWSKLKACYISVLQTVALVYPEWREAYLRKLKAEARLKELEVEEKEFDLFRKKIDYSLGLADRLSASPAKKALKQRVNEEVPRLTLKDPASPDVKEAIKNILGSK